jgi:hypothetical protein
VEVRVIGRGILRLAVAACFVETEAFASWPCVSFEELISKTKLALSEQMHPGGSSADYVMQILGN